MASEYGSALYGTDVYGLSYVDAQSGTVTVSGTATDAKIFTDTGSGTVTVTGTATESYGPTSVTYTDSQSGTVTVTGSGVDAASYTDATAGTVTLTGRQVFIVVFSGQAGSVITRRRRSVLVRVPRIRARTLAR